MDSRIKTAVAFGLAIAVAIGLINVYFGGIEDSIVPLPTPDTGPPLDKSAFKMAPDIVGISGYINTTPEGLEEAMEGNVVLYDIWTYSCINCIRTLPFITAWDDKYADQGLVIVGIHSPEFEFEKDIGNVRAAVEKYDINYPVILDNEKDTWKAFENRYWPRKYIADHEGYIRYDHIGEGAYAETELVIQSLLAERAVSLQIEMAEEELVDLEEFQHTRFRTPELYLGYTLARGNQIGNPERFEPGRTVQYEILDDKQRDRFYMDGSWINGPEGMILAEGSGSIELLYSAKELNIVASGVGTIEVYLDGEPIGDAHRGTHLDGHILHVSEPDLYNIVSSESAGEHEIWLRTDSVGIQVFTFTFG